MKALSKKGALIVLEKIWNKIDQSKILEAWDKAIESHFKDIEYTEEEKKAFLKEIDDNIKIAKEEVSVKLRKKTIDDLKNFILNEKDRLIQEQNNLRNRRKRAKNKGMQAPISQSNQQLNIQQQVPINMRFQ